MSLKNWILATRPWSFPVSAIPVLATTLFYYQQGYPIAWGYALLALAGMMLLHAASNVYSDYYDYKHELDRAEMPYCVQMLVNGTFTPQQYQRYAACLMLPGILIGLLLTYLCGWELLLIGGIGILLLLAYPWVKFIALGDLDILLCFGVLPMLGTAWVLHGPLLPSLWLSFPIGLITVAVLHANNTRDRRSDREKGARSLAYLLGTRASKITYILEITLPLVYVSVLCMLGIFPYGCLFTWFSLPVVVKNCQTILRLHSDDADSIARLDQQTAQLQLLFGGLFCLSFLV